MSPAVTATMRAPMTAALVRARTRPTPTPIRSSGHSCQAPATRRCVEEARPHGERDRAEDDEEDSPAQQAAVDVHRPPLVGPSGGRPS